MCLTTSKKRQVAKRDIKVFKYLKENRAPFYSRMVYEPNKHYFARLALEDTSKPHGSIEIGPGLHSFSNQKVAHAFFGRNTDLKIFTIPKGAVYYTDDREKYIVSSCLYYGEDPPSLSFFQRIKLKWINFRSI